MVVPFIHWLSYKATTKSNICTDTLTNYIFMFYYIIDNTN